VISAKDYRDLLVWQRAMDLVELVYRVTADFPPEETYGLKQQMCRCAVSIPSNIAEGQGRESPRDFIRFLNMANGSRRELETKTIIARRLDYLSKHQCSQVLGFSGEVGRLRHGLVQSLKRK